MRIACHGKAASPVVGRAVYAFIPEVSFSCPLILLRWQIRLTCKASSLKKNKNFKVYAWGILFLLWPAAEDLSMTPAALERQYWQHYGEQSTFWFYHLARERRFLVCLFGEEALHVSQMCHRSYISGQLKETSGMKVYTARLTTGEAALPRQAIRV